MYRPTKIKLGKKPLRLADADFNNSNINDKAAYRKELDKWQEKILHAQQAYYHRGE